MGKSGLERGSSKFERFLFGFTRAMVLLIAIANVCGIVLLSLLLFRLTNGSTTVSLSEISADSQQTSPTSIGTEAAGSDEREVAVPPIVAAHVDVPRLRSFLAQNVHDRKARQDFVSNLEAVLSEADNTVSVARVDDGSPAKEAGLQAGDVFIAVDGHRVKSWTSLIADIRAHPGKEFSADVQRNGKHLTLSITPRSIKDQDGKVVGQIGAHTNVDELPDKFAVAKIAKLQKSELEKYKDLGEETAMGAGIFWSVLSMALMSLILVVLAIERNTRPQPDAQPSA